MENSKFDLKETYTTRHVAFSTDLIEICGKTIAKLVGIVDDGEGRRDRCFFA
jgi:hypothetical protein